MEIIIFIGIVANLTLSFFISNEGNNREIGGNKSFWISAMFGFLAGALITGISRPLREDEKKDEDMGGTFAFMLVFLSIILFFWFVNSLGDSAESYSDYKEPHFHTGCGDHSTKYIPQRFQNISSNEIECVTKIDIEKPVSRKTKQHSIAENQSITNEKLGKFSELRGPGDEYREKLRIPLEKRIDSILAKEIVIKTSN
jgi:hypothetical protein